MSSADKDFPVVPEGVSGFDDPLVQFKEYLNSAMSVRALQTFEKHNLSFIPTKNYESLEDLAVSAASDLKSKNYSVLAFIVLDKFAPDFVIVNNEFAFDFMIYTMFDLIDLYESNASQDLIDERELEISYVEKKYFPNKFFMETPTGNVHYKSVLFGYKAARVSDAYNAQMNRALKEKERAMKSGRLDALKNINKKIEELENIRFF